MDQVTPSEPIDFSRYARQQPRYTPRPKAERKPRATTADDPYTKRKLAAQGRYRIGERYLYRGPNLALMDRIVKVVGHQSRGDIYVESSYWTRTCSPFTLQAVREVTLDDLVARRAAARARLDAMEPRGPLSRSFDELLLLRSDTIFSDHGTLYMLAPEGA
jgi:hypothetical protein